MADLLAHSAPLHDPLRDPQKYVDHATAVSNGAEERAKCLLQFAFSYDVEFAEVIKLAGSLHDLGKLSPENQSALASGRNARLPLDHIDAGVAHFVKNSELAAWLVRAHHSPGLPSTAEEAVRQFPLRGARTLRNKNGYDFEHYAFIDNIDQSLDGLIDLHQKSLGKLPTCYAEIKHGIPLRLALSCLVDADHEDTAAYDRGEPFPVPPEPRWGERIAALDTFVALLNQSGAEDTRQATRSKFYSACCDSSCDEPMTACIGPVGIGKTTAVLAFLLRLAKRKSLRRIFVVAPYTNIISQTVDRLRSAVVLPDEIAEEVVVEHHHRADYGSIGEREFATRWQAPIVVTTAVQFFETISGNLPGRLRKFHNVPGSAIFLDEAHAAIPIRLWPQCWQWLNELGNQWGCHFVFASGSLVEFWKMHKITNTAEPVQLRRIEGNVATEAVEAESKRIRYVRIVQALSRQELCERIVSESGPRLVILNTVQSAAVIARELWQRGHNVLHLSTALCPKDREQILLEVKQRFEEERRIDKQNAFVVNDCTKAAINWRKNWTLVATSCVEAGVDLSFQSAFREASSAASLIQVGGRVNRHCERGDGIVFSFRLQFDDMLTQHPDFQISADILDSLFEHGDLDSCNPTELVTRAMVMELKKLGDAGGEPLQIAEAKHDYPLVTELGRVINTDTRVVVVAPEVISALESGNRPDYRTLLRGSVQLWSNKIAALGLDPLPGFEELYVWKGTYDPYFLGYMAGVLKTEEFLRDPEACVI